MAVDVTQEQYFEPLVGSEVALQVRAVAQSDYQKAKQKLMDQALERISTTFSVDRFLIESLEKLERQWRLEHSKGERALRIDQQFRGLAVASLTSGLTGEMRTSEKVHSFGGDLKFLVEKFKNELKIDEQIISASISFASDAESFPQDIAKKLYETVSELRKHKTQLATQTSRIRSITDWILGSEDKIAQSLRNRNLISLKDLSGWVHESRDCFANANPRLEKFMGSYEAPWYTYCEKVFGASASYSTLENALRNANQSEAQSQRQRQAHRAREIETQFRYLARDADLRFEQANSEGQRADVTTGLGITLDLKANSGKYSAIYGIPNQFDANIPALQIEILMLSQSKYPELAVEIKAIDKPQNGIEVSSVGPVDAANFGKLQLELLTMLNSKFQF